jgi:F0F1-type ATP synthase epsilon subunit
MEPKTGIYHSANDAVIRPNSNILQVRILSPKKMIFLGQADALSSMNSTGKFDILPQHANFITLVKNKPIVVTTKDGQQQSFTFNLAIVLAINNAVTVYTDIGTVADTQIK